MAKRSSSKQSGEDKLIARYFAPVAKHPGALGLTDDAAWLKPPAGHDLVVTVDALVGGVHFFPDDPPGVIARKALRVNLSDLAAKGAKPAGFLLSLALPKNTSGKWLGAFSRGLAADAKAYACPLLGGDSVATPGPLTISVTAFGTLPRGRMKKRSGARAGDLVLVTGTLGDAALGLVLRRDRGAARRWALSVPEARHLHDRYLLPRPRNALAAAVRRHASAAMDVSDGLAGDLAKLCRVSGVSAVVDAGRVPLSRAARRARDADTHALETILTGGDDYEIVCTARPQHVASFRKAAAAAGVPLTVIGEVIAGREPVSFRDANGKTIRFRRPAFTHF